MTRDSQGRWADATLPWFTVERLPETQAHYGPSLGGYPISNSLTEGAVSTKGQVFRMDSAAPNKQVCDGLYMMDASDFPGPVAVNPTLTLVALALEDCGRYATLVEGLRGDCHTPATQFVEDEIERLRV